MNPLLIGGIIETVGKVADSLFTSDEERAKLKIEAMRAETEAYRAETDRMHGQLDINKEEAKHASVFVAGWRPAVGWVSVSALAYQFVLYPLLVWAWNGMQALGWIAGTLTPPPLLDVEALMVLVTGMLGIAGARTWEKFKGVAR
ncbi:holin family protein [Hydrogenophaga aquatica]